MSNLAYFEQTRREIAPLLPPRAGLVIEFGCSDGSTLAWLKESGRADKVVGVDADAGALAVAAARLDEALCVDMDHGLGELERFRGQADVILLLDVLEHLRKPQEALDRVLPLLKPGGLVVASIPNVRSIKVVFPLVVQGKFEYADSGILDRTHLVFFTKRSVRSLFSNAGLRDIRIRGNGALRLSSAKTAAGRVSALFNLATLRLFEEFLANQWLASGRKAD